MDFKLVMDNNLVQFKKTFQFLAALQEWKE